MPRFRATSRPSAAKSPCKDGSAPRYRPGFAPAACAYGDETRITPWPAPAMGEHRCRSRPLVTACEVQLRPRRQLLVQVEDATGVASCSFQLLPSQKTLAVGAACASRQSGRFWGGKCRRLRRGVVTAARPSIHHRRHPLSYLRRAIVSARWRGQLSDTLPPGVEPPVVRFLVKWSPAYAACARRSHICTTCRRQPSSAGRTQPSGLAAGPGTGPAAVSQYQSRRERDRLQRPGAAAARWCARCIEQLLAARLWPSRPPSAAWVEKSRRPGPPVPMHRFGQGDVGSGPNHRRPLPPALRRRTRAGSAR